MIEIMDKINVTIRRHQDGRSYNAVYPVPVSPGEVMSVMDILKYIYENIDPTLAFFSHAACRQTACGKCAVKVNGKTCLACGTRAVGPEILIEPRSSNIVRDLICGKE